MALASSAVALSWAVALEAKPDINNVTANKHAVRKVFVLFLMVLSLMFFYLNLAWTLFHSNPITETKNACQTYG